ncbi:hypothetical protein BX600DRAFT_511248 [Xylariales sp. PMI_506]|nr:hypothetical protein BX600DRAFT_511248 [Xylariales sp. PMI_506]
MTPYNTRRKSLSLPSLGIHVPTSKPQSTKTTTTSNGMSPKSAMARLSSDNSAAHPHKKVKRSHSNDVSATVPSKPAKSVKREDATPPPSPGLQLSIEMDESDAGALEQMKAIDLEGINDDIVAAVIQRLQETRNRPHLVKELSTVLMDQVKIVQQSANPCAIISSRLSGYLKRSCWSAMSPCPLAKELETVHPRRTYFYLTVCPHQPLPDALASGPLPQRSIVTPSLSSSASTTEDAESADADRRRELSMSPEVDLSSPEFDDMEEDAPMPGTPMGSVSVSRRRRPAASMSRNQKEEPPLEKDEKEFTQTADGLQKRKLSGSLLSANPVDADMFAGMQHESLFGEARGLNLAPSLLPHMAYMTSPAMRPSVMLPAKKDETDSWSKLDAMLDWDRSPETVELDELDCLLNDF